MRHPLALPLLMVFAVILLVAPALAQTQPPARPAPAAPAAPKTHEVEGTVSEVKPSEKTVKVSSGLFGLMGATVQVNEQTKIRVDGKDAALTELKEGAKVKATYESQDGKNLAKSIEAERPEEKQPAASPGARPGASSAPGARPKP